MFNIIIIIIDTSEPQAVQRYAYGQLLIFSHEEHNNNTPVDLIHMPLSQLQFRSNGSLVTYDADEIRLYTASTQQ